MWFSDRHFALLAVAIYGLSMIYSVFLWRKGFRQDNRVNYLLLLAGCCLHTTAMIKRGFSLNHCPVTNLYEATMFAAWTIVVIYLAVGLWSRLRFLGAFASPLLFAIGVFALMPSLDPPRGSVTEAATAWTSLHAALMSLAYGAFGLSSVAALMYLTQEHNLKFHKLQAILSSLPSIQRLESIVGRLLLSGFIMLTVGLSIGAYDLSRISERHVYRTDPKIIWSALVWLLYLGLLVMRWKFSQRGRRFAFGVIGSFVFVLLTFWGSNLLSPIHNPSAPSGGKELSPNAIGPSVERSAAVAKPRARQQRKQWLFVLNSNEAAYVLHRQHGRLGQSGLPTKQAGDRRRFLGRTSEPRDVRIYDPDLQMLSRRLGFATTAFRQTRTCQSSYWA